MINKKNKKRAVTLIEIMIVILLIGLIGGALAFNMRGSVDKGKLFKTEQNCLRVYDALMMEYAKGEKTLEQVVENRLSILKASPLVKDATKTMKDAWGTDLTIIVTGDDLEVFSEKARAMENVPAPA